MMNQEQNSLNSNNFNTQGNNGIPNNQGMSFNQQPINPQPTTQQPMSSRFESGNSNNQSFNSKPPKKRNLGLIIGIVAVVAVVGFGVIFGSKLLSNNGNNDNSNNSSNSNTNSNINENNNNVDNNLPEKITENIVRNYKVAPASDFEYENTDGGIKITKYKGNDLIVVIPEYINGKPVVELKSYLFANDSNVKGVYLPKTIEKIKYTFINNDNIQVVICEGIDKILDAVFANCKSLHTVVLDDSLEELGYFSFSTLPNLKEIYISSNMNKITEEIEGSVFHECPNLTITGQSGSFIETYANKHNIKFETN